MIFWASLEIKKFTKEAISLPLTNFWLGCFSKSKFFFSSSTEVLFLDANFFICFSTKGVSTHPGLIALQVILVLDKSNAIAFVNPIKPCLDAT